jgi:hypothetical protein
MIKRKVRNQPDFIKCRQCATYCSKALDEGYKFSLKLIVIRGLHAKLCAPKVAGVLVVRISGLPLGSPRTKSHLDVAPVERCKVYYKGEGGGFPQLRAVVSLVSPNCSWLVLAPKVLQLCTNHLVCKFVWVIEACEFILVPSWSSNTPLYPFKMLWAREHAPTPYSSVVFSLDSHFRASRSWEHLMIMLLAFVNAKGEINISCLGSNDWHLRARCKLGCVEAMCLWMLPIVSL